MKRQKLCTIVGSNNRRLGSWICVSAQKNESTPWGKTKIVSFSLHRAGDTTSLRGMKQRLREESWIRRPAGPRSPSSCAHLPGLDYASNRPLPGLYPASTRSPSRPSLALRRQPQRLLSADFNLSLNMNCYRLTGQNKSINLEVPYSTKTLSALSLSYYTWSFSFFLHQQNMRRENFTP